MSGIETRNGRLRLSPSVVVTVLEREAVLLDLETKFFYSVNASAWAIVQLLEVGAAREDIHRLCQSWGAPAHDVAAIDRVLDCLVEDKLVIASNEEVALPAVAPDGPWAAPAIDKHQEPLQRIMVSAFDPSIPLAE